MKTRTLKALKASIAHWKRFVNGTSAPGEAPNSDNCPLCALFYGYREDVGEGNCLGCPIFENTGRVMCGSTPYHAAWVEYDKNGKLSWSFQEKAQDMVEYLESLLPKKEVKAAKKRISLSQRELALIISSLHTTESDVLESRTLKDRLITHIE